MSLRNCPPYPGKQCQGQTQLVTFPVLPVFSYFYKLSITGATLLAGGLLYSLTGWKRRGLCLIHVGAHLLTETQVSFRAHQISYKNISNCIISSVSPSKRKRLGLPWIYAILTILKNTNGIFQSALQIFGLFVVVVVVVVAVVCFVF